MTDAVRRPKRNLAVYEETHQRVNELATGTGLSVADLFETERFAGLIEAAWREMLEAKLRAADPAFSNSIEG